MARFNPESPFPLLKGLSYSEEQSHSGIVDEWLGIRANEIERALNAGRDSGFYVGDSDTPGADGQQLWIGLPVQTLMTPYMEFRRILDEIDPPPGSTVIDLGAGYGRLGFVIGWHYPEVRFIGYELVGARVDEGNRCLGRLGFPLVQLKAADLNARDFRPEPADFYFMYDFGSRQAIDKALEDLRAIARHRTITVVGRGRSARDAIERRTPWLSSVVAPEHHGHYSIYRSGIAS